MRTSLFAAVLLLCAFAAAAADPPEYKLYLLPIVSQPTPGVNGSMWRSQFFVYNDQLVALDPNSHNRPNDPFPDIQPITNGCVVGFPGGPGCGTLPLIPSKSTQEVGLFKPAAGDPPGLILLVRKSLVTGVHFRLLVQDISRQALTAGTDVPVVGEEQLRTGKIHLLNVPTDDRFRMTLRVYDPDRRPSSLVRARIFGTSSLEPLAESELSLQPPPGGTDCQDGGLSPRGACKPSYGGVAFLLDTFPQLRGAGPVRVELEPLTPGLRMWALVSVIHNETQHVTLITPN